MKRAKKMTALRSDTRPQLLVAVDAVIDGVRPGESLMARLYDNHRVLFLASVAMIFGFAIAAQGNDRSLRGTMITPANCQPRVSALGQTTFHGTFTGNAWLGHNREEFILACPLSINNIELGSSSNDNDMSKFRIHYEYPTGSTFVVQLIKSKVDSGQLTSSVVCGATLNPSTNLFTTTTVACLHDLAGDGSFYYFAVLMRSVNGNIYFTGIDFPP